MVVVGVLLVWDPHLVPAIPPVPLVKVALGVITVPGVTTVQPPVLVPELLTIDLKVAVVPGLLVGFVLGLQRLPPTPILALILVVMAFLPVILPMRMLPGLVVLDPSAVVRPKN